MVFNRIWAMPNQWTFQIPPIRQLIDRYVKDNGKGWVDPFAGTSSIAEVTNDLNPDTPALYHLPAAGFCTQLEGTCEGVLFDPPYSPRQIAEAYRGIGLTVHMEDTQMSFYRKVKEAIAPKIKDGGIAICCGWNGGGFGIKRGFELIEILLVCHGGNRNDTIVTVERKRSEQLSLI